MKKLLCGLPFISGLALLQTSIFAADAKLTAAQTESVVAFAKLYSVVRYFHPSQSNLGMDWDKFIFDSTDRMLEVKSVTDIGPTLTNVFSAFPDAVEVKVGPFLQVSAQNESIRPLVHWRHLGLGVGQMQQRGPYYSWRTTVDPIPAGVTEEANRADPPGHLPTWSAVSLAASLHARVKTGLTVQEAKLGGAAPNSMPATSILSQKNSSAQEIVPREKAIAIGVAAWSVAAHFYPYWEDINVNWEAEFRQWIQAQPVHQSRKELQNSLRRLTARMDDGHAGVTDTLNAVPSSFLPITVRPIGAGYIVTASDSSEIHVGDQIKSVNGAPISEFLRLVQERTSASQQARPWRARIDFLYGPTGEVVKLGVRRESNDLEVELGYGKPTELKEKRPPAIAELQPGVFYIDISRFVRSAFEKALPSLSSAKTIIFDLRGYPAPGAEILANYWISHNDSAAWLHLPLFEVPFAPPTKFIDSGWKLEPKAGIGGASKILLIDPRAQSFSESLVGYFAAHANGLMIGEPTSGANGVLSQIQLPDGYVMRFTGMIVTSHEGRRFHTLGFLPNITVSPTAAGIASGRDEVLEKAIANVKAK